MKFKKYLILILCTCLFIVAFQPTTTQAQTQTITFSNGRINNNFPFDLTFQIDVSSTTAEITTVRLFYYLRNATSTTQQLIEIEPSNNLNLSYTWDTSNITIPPSAPIFYRWEVVDADGNRVTTDESLFFYDDIRYDWQILADDNLAVWWHDRPQAAGERIFNIAQQAFAQQQALFQAELDYPIRIIVYNDFDEFAEWHSFVNEFVGGQAFSPLGITTQVVRAYASEEEWLNNVIPHEISHLYFYQATYHPLSSVPLWLNEGIAQFNEFVLDERSIEQAQSAIASGNLLPLWSLSGSFGNDESSARLAYAQSLAAVNYMVKTYGSDGLSALLAAFREGNTVDEAMQAAFGLSLIDFQQAWIASQGVSPDLYPTPTPIPTMALPPTPAMMVPPTLKPTTTAEPETTPATTESTASTPMPAISTPIPATTVAQLNPSPTTPPAATSPPVAPARRGVCATAMLPLLALAFVRKRPKQPN